MKLHLPKGLKSAVLACIAVVGSIATTVGAGFVAGGSVAIAFVAAHAQAATYEITTNSDDNLTLATAEDQIILNLTGWLTWNGTLDINAPVKIIKGEFIDGSSHRTYTFKNTITGSGDFSYCPPSRSSANNLTYVFEGDMSAYSGNMSVVAGKKGTFTFRGTTGTGSVTALGAESVVNIEGATVNNCSINAATINISGAASFKSGISLNASRAINNSATITLDSVTLGHSITNTGSITLSGEVNLLDSLGTVISATTENGFVQKRYEIASGSGTLTLAEGVKLMVHGTDYAASYVAGEEVILTSTQYCVAESGSTVDSTTVEGETGYLVVGNNAVLKLTDLRDRLTGSLFEGVTVDVGNDNSATVEVSGAGVTFNANDITRTSGTLNVTVADGSTLELTQHTSSPNINGDLTIKAGGVVNATTGDVFGWGGNSTKNVILLGEESKLATLNLSNSVELSTNFVLSGNAQILSTSADATAPATLNTYGGKITATGTNNTIGVAIRALKALTIEVTGEDDTLDITGRIYDGAESITKTGAGTLTLSYSSEDNTNEINGLVNVEAGTLKFAGDTRLGAGVKVAAGASLVNEGTITLTSLSLLNILGIDAYQDATGAVSENGYRAGRYTVIEAQAGATITGVNSVMLDGETLATAVDKSSGSIYVAGVDNSTYWVNTQVAYDAETMSEAGIFNVAAGATLTTTDATMFNKVTLADATSSLYFTNREGMRALEFSDYSISSAPHISGGNVFFCSADADSLFALCFKDSDLGGVKSLTFDTLSNLTFSTSSIRQFYKSSLTITNVNDGQSGTVDVLFEDMKRSSSSSYCEGGAINRTKVIISNNGDVTFRGNSAEAYTSFTAYSSGGAIYVSGSLTISNNNDVTFCGNSAYSSDTDSTPIAYSKGGAIYASGSLTISNNNNVIFSRNSANSYTPVYAVSCSTDGGAICAAGDLTISNNNNVIFNGNSAYVSSNWLHSNGGAISASGDLTISNNNNVIFSGNSAAYSLTISDYDDIDAESFGGAIYVYNTYDNVSLHIQGNDSVLFEKNYINSNGSYRLESINISSHHASVNMSLSSKTGGNITFYDSVYSSGTTYFNSDYTDADGNTTSAKGDVIFSGKYAEQHLNEILAANNENRTATGSEILNSQTSIIGGNVYVNGGSLQIVDGAVVRVYGDTVSIEEGSNATLAVSDAKLVASNATIEVGASATLQLSNGASVSADEINIAAGATLALGDVTITTSTSDLMVAAYRVSSLNIINADLTFAAGSTLVTDGIGISMTRGSILTFNATSEGEKVNLVLTLGAEYSEEDQIVLFSNVDIVKFLMDGEEVDSSTTLMASDFFTGDCINENTTLTYDSTTKAVYLQGVSKVVPEPTTATLSLLALAALAMRRRRQK